MRTLLWTSVGIAAGFPALVVPGPEDPRLTVIIHLFLLGVFAIGLVFHLAPLGDEPWFDRGGMGIVGRRAATWIAITAMVTASAATAAAATAAALRYDASMQYLVVLAADAMALPAAAAILGGRRRFGPKAAVVIGFIVAADVLWSVARYLGNVGVGPGGAWIVDGARFGTLILPFLAASAVAAAALFTAGTRHR